MPNQSQPSNQLTEGEAAEETLLGTNSDDM